MEIASDPYAGIFFSKDRVETIIEADEKEVTHKIRVDGTEYQVSILGRGAWMSGCPEEGEILALYLAHAQGSSNIFSNSISAWKSPWHAPTGVGKCCSGTIETSSLFS